jgi:hypothetical protein
MRRIRTAEPSGLHGPSRQALVLRWLPAAAVLALGIAALVLYEGRRPPQGSPRISVELQELEQSLRARPGLPNVMSD